MSHRPFSGVFAYVCTLVAANTLDSDWQLVWNDEFDSDRVNMSKWEFQEGGHGWGNQELQYYTSDNAEVGGGVLAMNARRESRDGNEYTSARMHTRGLFDFQYGRLEFRARLPRTSGLWPALWMLPSDNVYGRWPKSGEIDVMEFVPGSYYGARVLSHIQTGAYNHIQTGAQGHHFYIDTATSDFHTYSLRWEPDCLEWEAGGETFYVYRKPAGSTSDEWPFDQPFHILMNVAVGGFGGKVDDGMVSDRMEIDYVRVYQRNYTRNSVCRSCIAVPVVAAIGMNVALVLLVSSFVLVAVILWLKCSSLTCHSSANRSVVLRSTVAATVITLLAAIVVLCEYALTQWNFCVEGPMWVSAWSIVDGRVRGSYLFGSWFAMVVGSMAILVAGSVPLARVLCRICQWQAMRGDIARKLENGVATAKSPSREK